MHLHFWQLFWSLIIKMMLWIYSLWAAVALTYLHHKKDAAMTQDLLNLNLSYKTHLKTFKSSVSCGHRFFF